MLLWLGAACQLPSEAPPASPVSPPPVEAPPDHAALPPEQMPPPDELPAPGDSTLPAKPIEPGVTTTGAPTRGQLPKAVVDEKLQAAQPAIVACYERALQATPGLRGNVSVSFVVGTDGRVAHAEAAAVDDPLTDVATVDCIVAEIRKLEFPEPRGGRVFLSYPLKLEPPAP
jgi:hypothetical protein